MHRGRILLLVAAGVAASSLLFPALSAEIIGDLALARSAGIGAVAALATAAVVAMSGDRGESLGGLPAVAAAATVALALLLAGALLIDGLAASRAAGDLGVSADVGAGLWLLVAATVLAVGGIIVATSRRLS